MNPDADPTDEDTPIPLALLEASHPPVGPTEVADQAVGPWPFLAQPGNAPPPASATDRAPTTLSNLN